LNQDKKELIRHRFRTAVQTKEEVSTLLEKGHIRGAINRIYYSMFYATKALLATKDLDASKHSGVIALFHKEFIRTGEIEKEYGVMLQEAFERRSKSDYIDFTTFDNEMVKSLFGNCEAFLERIKSFLKESIGMI